MKTTLRNLTLALASGYILTFYSEFLFYGQLQDPGTPPPTALDLLLLWAIYSLMAYVVMALIRRYRVASLPALLVVGAAYGWMLEGGIVATAYESLPWSLSFTALAWHMPIDVLFGLYLVPKWLRQKSAAFNLRAAALTGVLWGFWAVWGGQVTPLRPAWFLVFAFVTAGLLLGAYWVIGRVGLLHFQPRRGGMILAGVLFLAWAVVTAIAVPLSLLILPILLGVCWWALRRSAAVASPPDVLDALDGQPRLLNLLVWLAFPLIAALEYAFWASTGWQIASNVVGYLLLTPLGFLLFLWALWKTWRTGPRQA